MSFFELNKFDKCLKELEKEYSALQSENDELRRRLAEYNKDEEIQKLERQIKLQSEMCLHLLVGKEKERVENFREKHYHSCNNGNRYIFELTGTGIGEGIEIKCPICSATEDVTDVDCW